MEHVAEKFQFTQNNLRKLSDSQIRELVVKLSEKLGHDPQKISSYSRDELEVYLLKNKNYIYVLIPENEIESILNSKSVVIDVGNDTTEENESSEVQEEKKYIEFEYQNLHENNVVLDQILNLSFLVEYCPLYMKRKNRYVETNMYRPIVKLIKENQTEKDVDESIVYDIYRKPTFITSRSVIDKITEEYQNYIEEELTETSIKIFTSGFITYTFLSTKSQITENDIDLQLGFVVENSYSGIKTPKIYYGILDNTSYGFLPITSNIVIDDFRKTNRVEQEKMFKFFDQEEKIHNKLCDELHREVSKETIEKIIKTLGVYKTLKTDFSNLTNGSYELVNVLFALSRIMKRVSDSTMYTNCKKIISEELSL